MSAVDNPTVRRLKKRFERMKRRATRGFRPLVYCDDYLEARGGPMMRYMTDDEVAALPPGELDRLHEEAYTFRPPEEEEG